MTVGGPAAGVELAANQRSQLGVLVQPERVEVQTVQLDKVLGLPERAHHLDQALSDTHAA